jgi:hypothetical protein
MQGHINLNLSDKARPYNIIVVDIAVATMYNIAGKVNHLWLIWQTAAIPRNTDHPMPALRAWPVPPSQYCWCWSHNRLPFRAAQITQSQPCGCGQHHHFSIADADLINGCRFGGHRLPDVDLMGVASAATSVSLMLIWQTAAGLVSTADATMSSIAGKASYSWIIWQTATFLRGTDLQCHCYRHGWSYHLPKTW